MLKNIPTFNNEDEEREFWATHSFLDYVDLATVRKVAPLVPLPGALSVEVKPPLADELKRLSVERQITIEDLIAQLIAAGLKHQGVQPRS